MIDIQEKYVTLTWGFIRDKSTTMQEKLLLMEILNLSMLEHGCIASNSHFAKLMGIKREAVSRLLSNLVKKGYIETKIRKGSRNFDRTITINKMLFDNNKMLFAPLTKCYETKDNISDINIRNNNIYMPYLKKWNSSPSLPKHKPETVKLKIKKKHIDILKLYSKHEIISAIEAYNTLLSSDEYWYTHRFTFWRFIEKIEEFMPDMKPLENFRNKSKPKTESFTPVQNTGSWRETPDENLNFEELKNAR